MVRTALIETALGRRKPDLHIRNGNLVNVYTGEILEGCSVSIWGRHIAAVGTAQAPGLCPDSIVDAQGAYLVPGYIDPHAHVDFWANPLALTEGLLAGGTTLLMSESHDLVGATGLAGLDLLMDMTRGLALKFFFSLPVSAPPYPDIEGDDVVPLEKMADYLARGEILALSEVTPWVRIIETDPGLLSKFEMGERWGKRIEGHTTGAAGPRLNALVSSGLTSCHEAITAEEARERLRLGLAVMLRHGSIRSDLSELIRLVTENPGLDTRRVMFTPDWKSPSDILTGGYMDRLVEAAVEAGVSPVTAIQMATLNSAVYLGLDREFGGIAPGRRADILLVDDLRRPTPRMVIADGRIVARDGQITEKLPPVPPQARTVAWLSHRDLPDPVRPDDFHVAGPVHEGETVVPGMAVVNKTITRREDFRLPVRNGRIVLPEDGGILKISLMKRDRSGFLTVFLGGFGSRIGGLASSIAHELHQPVVIGGREEDMAAALNRVRETGGGVVLVQDGRIRCEIPLPIAGMMSEESLEGLAGQMGRMTQALRETGCPLDDPLFTMGFLTFSALPWIRLTPAGLFDVKTRKVI
jgi:adenine deaminase